MMDRVRLASGIELDVQDTGPRDAPALVFLHGFPESHRTWRHQVAHFADRFRCIAPDQRGYRGSSKPQDPADYAFPTLVGDVFQLADALGVARFTVIGHDWGGAIAWGVALAGQGRRVERAVICNAPHPVLFQKLQWTDPVQRAASQYVRLFRDTSQDDAIAARGLTAMLRRAFAPEALTKGMEAEEITRLLTDWRDPEAAIGMLNWYRGSTIDVPAMDAPYGLGAYGLGEDRVLPAVPPLDIPTLVVWATDDLALPLCNLDGLAEGIADLAVVKVPDCGHFVPWQAPGAVNAALEAFLARQ